MLSRYQTQKLAGVAMCITAAVGLYFKVEYCGWLMFAGIILSMD